MPPLDGWIGVAGLLVGVVWLVGPLVTAAAYLLSLRLLTAAHKRERAAAAADLARTQNEITSWTGTVSALHYAEQEIDRLTTALATERADRDRLLAAQAAQFSAEIARVITDRNNWQRSATNALDTLNKYAGGADQLRAAAAAQQTALAQVVAVAAPPAPGTDV